MVVPAKFSIHLYIIVFYIAEASFIPFLGYWFLEEGLSNQQIGLLSSLGPMVGLAAQPLWGMLSDRFGAEKRVLMISMFLTPIFACGYLLAGDVFLLFMVTALLYSLFFTTIKPISDAVTVNHAKTYNQSYGSIRVLGSISFAICITPFGYLYDHVGINFMFGVYFVMMMAALVALLLVGKPVTPILGTNSLLSGVGGLLKDCRFVCFLVLVFLIAIGNQFLGVFFSVYVGQLGGDVSQRIGLLNSVSSISELPFFLLSAWFIRKYGIYHVLTVTGVAAALRWWILSTEPTFTVLMTSQLLHGLTFALFMAAGVTFAYEMSPNGLKSTGQTMFAIVNYNLANLIASNGGGWMIDHNGFPTLFLLGAILSLLGAFGFWMMSRRKRFQVSNE